MEFRKQKSIYQQIADRLMDQLLAGTPPADERMPSVRDVAVSLGVNPNTVMRSFDYLQQEGIIYNRRGAAPTPKRKSSPYSAASSSKRICPSSSRRCACWASASTS